MRHTNSYADGKPISNGDSYVYAYPDSPGLSYTYSDGNAYTDAYPSCTPAAGQITTLFASNNNGSAGGANYFDVTVASNPITVTALDINTAATVGV